MSWLRRIRWTRVLVTAAIVAVAALLWVSANNSPDASIGWFMALGGVESVLVVFLIYVVSNPLAPQRRSTVFVRAPAPGASVLTTAPGVSLNVDKMSTSLQRPTYDAEMYAQGPAELLAEYAVLAAESYAETRGQWWNAAAQSGWQRLECDLPAAWSRHGLGVRIWTKTRAGSLVVAVVFRGTRGLRDWVANLHWVVSVINAIARRPLIDNHYTLTMSRGFSENIARALAHAKVTAGPACELIAVGHSLGAGLAQCFANTFRVPEQPRVTRVFAFDPSPVTGPMFAQARDRDDLTVVHVFQHGEVLSYLRLLLASVCPGLHFQTAWTLRFNFSKRLGVIFNHSMAELATQLRELRALPVPQPRLDPQSRLQQLQLIYDYIKFHIGLYIGTPPVLAILAQAAGMGVTSHPAFLAGMSVMTGLYVLAGMHAGWFMGNHVNTRWESDFLEEFESEAFSAFRRFMHHWIYWAGLIVGLSGIVIARYLTPMRAS